LAAEGLSNREIGQRLYISHRTIAYHLRRIFRSSVSALAVSFTRPCSVWRRDGVEPLAIRVRPDALRRSVDDIPLP
jgi:hypothetical protein